MCGISFDVVKACCLLCFDLRGNPVLLSSPRFVLFLVTLPSDEALASTSLAANNLSEVFANI